MAALKHEFIRCATLRIGMPCALAEVRPAVLAVRAFLAEHGLDEEELGSCELALAEACNNAVQHTPTGRRDRPIQLEAVLEPLHVELLVTDQGPGFEWPTHVELPEPEMEGGRGLFLIQSLMGHATYLRGPDRNCLLMRRALVKAVAASAGTARTGIELERLLAADERIIRDMTDELSSCYESLAAIFRFGREQGGPSGIKEFSSRLLDDLLRVTQSGWHILRLLDRGTDELSVFTASDPTLYLRPLQLGETASLGPSLELESVRSRRDVWFDQPGMLQPDDPLSVVGLESVGLVHPVYFGETLIGTLAVGGGAATLRLTAAQVNVIHTFSDFLAIQIMNTRYQEERVGALLVARELEIARHIQRSLLLKNLPEVGSLQLSGYCESSGQVGGDFFDVLKISDTSMLALISDVMGSGIPAAMFAVILRGLVRASTSWAAHPAELLRRVNQLLFTELSDVEMFITVQLVHVDLAKDQLTVASAGHCPLLVAGTDGRPPRAISPEGMPLGVLPEPEFAEEVMTLEPGLRVLLYTDGLTEVSGPDGSEYGTKRLAGWLSSCAQARMPVGTMKENLLEELNRFRFDEPLRDDQTFLILSR
jgi:serine phosphatase RsbU (regulator of sigma subunit)/anti-sigma regulatory factor (Ser/Thr protein kinase)